MVLQRMQVLWKRIQEDVGYPNMRLPISSSKPDVPYIFLNSNPHKNTFLLTMSLTTKPCSRYKLPLTITDSSGCLDAIAFSKVAENLVEHHADQVSMNMKIDAADHAIALENAIGKERLFYIGMNTAANYPIKYVLKRSYSLGNTNSMPMLTAPMVSNLLIVITFLYPTY